MAESLGEKLRLAREARGITLSEVAAQTRIAARYLEAIEADNYKPLPGGVFNKGFIKAYAKYVGVDEQEALSDYARLMSTQVDPQDAEGHYKRPMVMTDDRNRSSASSLIFAVIILVLMSGGIYALVQWYRSAPAALPVKNTIPANTAGSNANTQAANTAGDPVSTDQLKVELKSMVSAGEVPPSVTTAIDGEKAVSGSLTPDAPRMLSPQTNVKISYSKYQAEKLQMTVNGKIIALPKQPLSPGDKEIVRFEINRDNLAQILQSGQIVPAEQGAPAANINTAAAASTPKPSPRTTPAKTTQSNTNTAAPAKATPRPIFSPVIINAQRKPD